MSEVARRMVRAKPEVVVLISPHAPRRGEAFTLRSGTRIRGSLAAFGAPYLAVDLPAAGSLARCIEQAATCRGVVMEWLEAAPLDHGAVVPLWHLAHAGWNGPTVVVGLNDPGSTDRAEMGAAIAEAARRGGSSIAVIASGDMSHRLQPGAPSGFHPRAVEFDHALIDCLEAGDLNGLCDLDPVLQDLAGEDAVDSTLVAASAVGWDARGHEVLSYQGPFGVGYGVAILYGDPEPVERGRESANVAHPSTESRDGAGEPLPGIARRSVEAALRGVGGIPEFEASGIMAERRAVFVTLRDADGELRGCVGDLKPRYVNTAVETWNLARDAAFGDSRFRPVTADLLPRLRFEVSVLGALEEVDSPLALDARRYGVVLETADGRRGALLPDIEGIDSVAEQMSLVRRKGGIGASESVRLWRFTVTKFLEDRHHERPGL